MDAATLEEMNKQRIALGMKPLPVPGAAPDSGSDSDSESEDEGSTLESRQEAAFDNYQKLRAEKEAKKRREDQAEAIRKAREKAQRVKQLQGKGLGDAPEGEDGDAKTWLLGQKKRQKKIAKARKLEQEQAEEEARAAAALQHTSKDLAGVKVAHDMSSFVVGGEQILTLKDATIGEYEDEGDELENLALREDEKLKEKLDLKKKKPDYNPLDDDANQGLLSKYDEEIYGKQAKNFTLGGKGAIADLTDILEGPKLKANQGHIVDLDLMGKNSDYFRVREVSLTISTEDAPKSSDYLDISEIKIKKPKKKKEKSSRRKPLDPEDLLFPKSESEDEKMDIDPQPAAAKRTAQDTNLIDDDDLQSALTKQRQSALKKRKRMKPEDFAKQIREQAEIQEEEPQEGSGLVIGQVSEFVANIKKRDEDEPRPKRKKTPEKPSVTAMDGDSDEDHPMNGLGPTQEEATLREQIELEEAAQEQQDDDDDVLKEKPVSNGVGAALALLRDRGILKDTHGSELHESFRQQEQFRTMKAKMRAEQEEEARKQRENDRRSGRMERMGVHSHRDQQDWAAEQNKKRDLQNSREMAKLYNSAYQPTFKIEYTDEYGRSVGPKEAFKNLSHQFHGKGSGKGKKDKQLKKIAEEKRKEAQGVLDASQSVGMSSVAQQQTKKRKEAGVRIA